MYEMNVSAIRPVGPTLPARHEKALLRAISNTSSGRHHPGMLSQTELRRAVAEMID
jgi:hypothetical protein